MFTLNDAKKEAKETIKLYIEGSDITSDQEHVLLDTATEHGQILENVMNTAWFLEALSENIWASRNS